MFGPFRIDPTERVLRSNGDIVPLTPKVFEMLLALWSLAGGWFRRRNFSQNLAWRIR